MARTICIKMMGREIELDLPDNVVTKSTIISALLLPTEAVVSLCYEVDGRQKCVRMNETGTAFILPEDLQTKNFLVESNKVPCRPATPSTIISITNPKVPMPPPSSKSIEKWMFFACDAAGKSTVVCVHPRFFVTFRHGSHLQLQLGSALKIFHAKANHMVDSGYEAIVVDINETLDFVLLRSKEKVVERGPLLVQGEETEMLLLAGIGLSSSGYQCLAYVDGLVYSNRGYYFTTDNKPTAPLMGPFDLVTVTSSRRYFGAACWSSRGLVGIYYGVTCGHLANPKAAAHSANHIISPANRIEEAIMTQLHIEQQHSRKSSPSKKQKLIRTEIEGLGRQTLFVDKEQV